MADNNSEFNTGESQPTSFILVFSRIATLEERSNAMQSHIDSISRNQRETASLLQKTRDHGCTKKINVPAWITFILTYITLLFTLLGYFIISRPQTPQLFTETPTHETQKTRP
jgi:hypothetical protein